ncbi:MAG: peptide chain release factor N(5)-glutamine methyltransferase [Nitrospirae bacterium]|nr:peptide chain release factor N(5)-glutamine methyltransferase [Nitrospirota bacterium]
MDASLPIKAVRHSSPGGENLTLSGLVKFGENDLQSCEDVESPGFEAELLLSALLKCRRLDLYLRFDERPGLSLIRQYGFMLERRHRFEPLQYITGREIFLNREFSVGPGVLVPRPETELLAEEAMRFLNRGPFLDLGTGSGCIAISLWLEKQKALEGYAVDISPEALGYARKNAKSLGAVSPKLHWVKGDLFHPLPDHLKNAFEVIVSNPPYLDMNRDKIGRSVRKFEPLAALDGGEGGLTCYSRIFKEAVNWLKPDGFLILEMGMNQAGPLMSMLKGNSSYRVLNILKDEQGIDRVLTIGFNGAEKKYG